MNGCHKEFVRSSGAGDMPAFFAALDSAAGLGPEQEPALSCPVLSVSVRDTPLLRSPRCKTSPSYWIRSRSFPSPRILHAYPASTFYLGDSVPFFTFSSPPPGPYYCHPDCCETGLSSSDRGGNKNASDSKDM